MTSSTISFLVMVLLTSPVRWTQTRTQTHIIDAPAVAAEYDVGSIHITQPWARATAKGATTGAGYMTITNKGTTPDRVSCISSDASVQCQMHSMTMEAGVITTCSALFGPRPTCGLGPMADSTRY